LITFGQVEEETNALTTCDIMIAVFFSFAVFANLIYFYIYFHANKSSSQKKKKKRKKKEGKEEIKREKEI